MAGNTYSRPRSGYRRPARPLTKKFVRRRGDRVTPRRKYTKKTATSMGSYGKSKSFAVIHKRRVVRRFGRDHVFAADALKVVPKQTRVYDTQGSMITAQGSQAFQNIIDVMPTSRLQTFIADSTAYEKVCFVEGAAVNTTLFNMTSDLIARITIYDWQSKVDDIAGLTIESAITNGYAAKYGVGNPQNIPFMDPSESPEFNRFFKIVKKTEVVLAPNENHHHKHSHVINKWYDNLLETNITASQYTKGFSSGVMIRVLGGCVGGTSTGAGAHTITYGAVRVGWVNQIRDYVKFPQGASANTVIASVGTMALSDIGTPQVPLSYNDTLVVPNTTM